MLSFALLDSAAGKSQNKTRIKRPRPPAKCEIKATRELAVAKIRIIVNIKGMRAKIVIDKRGLSGTPLSSLVIG